MPKYMHYSVLCYIMSTHVQKHEVAANVVEEVYVQEEVANVDEHEVVVVLKEDQSMRYQARIFQDQVAANVEEQVHGDDQPEFQETVANIDHVADHLEVSDLEEEDLKG